jgi:hypothetical protein
VRARDRAGRRGGPMAMAPRRMRMAMVSLLPCNSVGSLLALFMLCVLPCLQPERTRMMMMLPFCKGLMSDWESLLLSTGAIHEGNGVTCLFVSGDGASVCC